MYVSYNGIRFEQSEIQSIHRESVWDEWHIDLLYIKWTIGLVAFYSGNGVPTATSTTTLRAPPFTPTNPAKPAGGMFPTGVYQWFRNLFTGFDASPTAVNLRDSFAANNSLIGPDAIAVDDDGDPVPPDPAVPVTGRGYGPILTDVTLRNRLMTPRQQLIIAGADVFPPFVNTATSAELLRSPKTGFPTDPINGPHPIALDILDGNDQGFAVFFQIQTATLPCDDNSDRLVLSHRWTVSHTHDENQYLTQITDGEIVFNGGMVNLGGLDLDKLRQQFFPQIPLGCYRTIPFVTPSADGLSYHYRVEDHDQSVVFDAGDSGATSIDIVESMNYYKPRIANVIGK